MMRTSIIAFMALMLCGSQSFAATAREIAYARLVIAKSIIEKGNESPDLPDSPPRADSPTQEAVEKLPPVPGDSHDASDTRRPKEWASEVSAAKAEVNTISLSLLEARKSLDEQKAIAEQLTLEKLKPFARSFYEQSVARMPPMRLEPIKEAPKAATAVVSSVPAVQLVVRCWPVGCEAGEKQKAWIQDVLGPKGWKIGTTEDCHIRFMAGDSRVEGCPHIILYRNGEIERQWYQLTDPILLGSATRAAQDSLPKSSLESPVAASGIAGTIHAASQIQAALDYFRKYVGPGNQASMTWDRNGDAALNLFAMKNWDAAKLFGSDGRIELSSPDALNLPVKEFAFGYRIRGSDMIFDGEPVTVRGLADKLRISPAASAVEGQAPVGLIGIDDALLLYSVVCMLRDIVAILQPSADLILPNQISATAVLNGDVLTITFNRPPAVKLTWLITAILTVNKVTITASNVHVDFTGSIFVKSRDFPIAQ